MYLYIGPFYGKIGFYIAVFSFFGGVLEGLGSSGRPYIALYRALGGRIFLCFWGRKNMKAKNSKKTFVFTLKMDFEKSNVGFSRGFQGPV